MDGSRRRVLVVEDDHDVREVVREILDDEGYTVTTAENGEAALAKLRSEPLPSLIVLDMMMPVMDGWQFRREQLADPALAGIPVVVLSAVADSARLLGVAALLSKPLDLDTLLYTVARHAA